MYHSVTFGEKNTYDDWHLMSSTRPYFNPPAFKSSYVDIPGANGGLDISTALTGYPTYERRTGSLTFIILNGYRSWVDTYSEIAEYIHGKEMKAYLEDDPDFYYEGRFELSEWIDSSPRSGITISYNLDPFKWSKRLSNESWLWDPFVFATDTTWTSPFDAFKVDSDVWWRKTFLKTDFGSAPVCPKFIVQGTGAAGMDVRYKNLSMRIDREEHLTEGESYFPGFIFYGYSDYELYFKGHGAVSMEFRYGRL